MHSYQLVYSDKRRTLALQIKQGRLIVRAPSFLSKIEIDKFVAAKSDWLNKKLSLTTVKNTEKFAFNNGDTLFIHGVKKTFFWQAANNDSVDVSPEQVVININLSQLPPESIKLKLKELLQAWFYQDIEQYLKQYLPIFSQRLGLFPKQIKIRQYKARWGSCNSKQNLTFNLLLAMVPRSVLNYVIVHELAHLQEMNHSVRFWQIVATYHPYYQQDIRWLKQSQQDLSLSL